MKILVDVKTFLTVLRSMKPLAAASRKSATATIARITAGGSSVVLLGDFDNGASLPAEVLEPGAGHIAIADCLRILSTYPKKATVEIRTEDGAFWLDKLRLTVRSP